MLTPRLAIPPNFFRKNAASPPGPLISKGILCDQRSSFDNLAIAASALGEAFPLTGVKTDPAITE
jgi:hypothetical protein